MIPSRAEAERLLAEAESCNPGPWGNHSRIAAHCAEKIAEVCDGMDSEKAYILGLLHDIGRKFGIGHLKHVSDGYTYMMSLGYDEAAKICLTHLLRCDKEVVSLWQTGYKILFIHKFVYAFILLFLENLYRYLMFRHGIAL